jgi:hypothetical protein
MATKLGLCRVRDVRSDRAFEGDEDELAGEALLEHEFPMLRLLCAEGWEDSYTSYIAMNP